MRFSTFFCFLIISILLGASCKKHEKGTIEIVFSHTVDDAPVQFNKLIYKNAAGNNYQINEIKYFVSRMCFIDAKGKAVAVSQNSGIHYVDCSISNTLRLLIEVPQGDYVAVSFVFGLDENDNLCNRFLNPPECNFAWPNPLGGGYHYMQINGKFLNKEENIQNLNIHTGIGQVFNENNEVSEFIHNHFTVTLPIDLFINTDCSVLTLKMEIQRWFYDPNLYNFNDFGTGIMQKQEAQRLLKENGKNVFELVVSDQW